MLRHMQHELSYRAELLARLRQTCPRHRSTRSVEELIRQKKEKRNERIEFSTLIRQQRMAEFWWRRKEEIKGREKLDKKADYEFV